MIRSFCISCGDYTPKGLSRCAACKLPTAPRKATPGRKGRTATDWQWRKLSQRLRKASPFCERCGSKADLTVDHRIPLSERPDLAREPLNCAVLCRSCNTRKGVACTDAEREQVLAAIAKRRQRAAGYSTGMGNAKSL